MEIINAVVFIFCMGQRVPLTRPQVVDGVLSLTAVNTKLSDDDPTIAHVLAAINWITTMN